MDILTFLCVFVKVPVMAVGIYYFKSLTKPYKMVLCLIAVGFTFELYGYYIAHFLHRHNAWLFNIYIILEVWALSGAALHLLENIKAKRLFFSLLIANTIFWAITLITKSIFVLAHIPMITGCLLMALLYMYVLISSGIFNRIDILKQPVFWLSISIISYTACDIPFMSLHSYLHNNSPLIGAKLQGINSILNIIRYPLTGVSFILLDRQSCTPHSRKTQTNKRKS